MPEITELHNFFHYLSQMIHLYLSGLPVLAIWADLTVEENTRLNGNGKPVILDHLCGFTRGSGNQRGPLWPPEHLVPALSECSSSDAFQKSQLKIIGVEWHPRRVVLNLNSVYLSVSSFFFFLLPTLMIPIFRYKYYNIHHHKCIQKQIGSNLLSVCLHLSGLLG
jgi:hypothetical protein